MAYIGWAANVNRRIIDSTTITIGEGGAIEDNVEGGQKKKRRMSCSNPSDKYSVTMHFNWSEVGEDGLTEYQRFTSWYKNVHKFGTNPFQFPAILFNSNNKSSFSEEEVERGNMPANEWYVITSTAEGGKYGFDVAVKMTWETYATGLYEAPYGTPVVNSVRFQNGYAVIGLQETGDSAPTTANFSLKINNSTVPVGVYCSDDAPTLVYVTYPKLTEAGIYTLKLKMTGLEYDRSISDTATAELEVR